MAVGISRCPGSELQVPGVFVSLSYGTVPVPPSITSKVLPLWANLTLSGSISLIVIPPMAAPTASGCPFTMASRSALSFCQAIPDTASVGPTGTGAGNVFCAPAPSGTGPIPDGASIGTTPAFCPVSPCGAKRSGVDLGNGRSDRTMGAGCATLLPDGIFLFDGSATVVFSCGGAPVSSLMGWGSGTKEDGT